jgi:hypothetical protein
MAYVLPQVKVFQDFRLAPVATAGVLNAHISGGHAELFRYSDATEKEVINLGGYDSLSDTSYEWPSISTGSVVDLSYVKLYMDNAKLNYYQNNVGVGGAVAPVAGYPNRIIASGVSFRDNGTAYPKSNVLLDRGAKVGDGVWVRGVASGVSYEINTFISGFIGAPVASTRSASSNGVNNKATTGGALGLDNLSTIINTVTITPNKDNYDGSEDGYVDEYYTIEVIQSSGDGDFTTARLRVTTASGLDNVASVAAASAGSFTTIGTRGLRVIFDNLGDASSASASAEASEFGVSANDLVVGQKWRIHVTQAVTATVATSAGTYTGTSDTIYIVEVTKGGLYASSPEITVSTTSGVDYAAPLVVSAAATAFAVGNEGVTVSFSGTKLIKGDKFYITVTGVAAGAYSTIVLQDDLPVQIRSNGDLDLKLFIIKDLEIPEKREESAPNVNYEASYTEFIVKENNTVFVSDWTEDGVEVPLPIEGGTLFVEYRAWLQTFVSEFGSIQDPGNITETLGVLHPDNPLCWGVFTALENAGGQEVRFTAVSNPDQVNDWLDVLDVLGDREDLYNMVPLTFDQVVLDAYAAHAVSQSGPEVGRWRAVVLGIRTPRKIALVNAALSSDEAEVLATISDDPATTGTQYTRLSVPANNARFVTKKVRAGDTVRYFYTTDGFNRINYVEYIVSSVSSESTLTLKAGPAAPVSIAQKVEIWRNQNNTEYSTTIGEKAGKYSSTRVVAIANDNLTMSGYKNQPSYFLAAAVAGLRSGSNPHQGLTSVSVSGVDYVGDAINGFNVAQLNTIAGSGGWIITKAEDGSFINRHAVTTNNLDLNAREEQVRTNVDNMSYAYRSALVPYIGRSNVTASTLTNIRIVLTGVGTGFQLDTGTDIGPQLIDFDIRELRQHAVLKDHVVVVILLTIPYPLNNVELHLVV